MNDQQSIRPFLASLEEDDALLRIPKEVDPAFELSAFLSAAELSRRIDAGLDPRDLTRVFLDRANGEGRGLNCFITL